MNLSEAVESGKRWNRALRQEHWNERVYLYEKEGYLFLNSPECEAVHNKLFEFSLECIAGYDWSLSWKAPWYGPAGMITRERITEAIKGCCGQALEEDGLAYLVKPLTDLFYLLANGTIGFIEQPKETAGDSLLFKCNNCKAEFSVTYEEVWRLLGSFNPKSFNPKSEWVPQCPFCLSADTKKVPCAIVIDGGSHVR